jgi:hypothetical protein
LQKEAEKLAQDSKTKKEAFLQSQSAVNDATAHAKETREEADRLQKEAEDAEMKAASAASMKTMQAQEPATNGYPSTVETEVPYMGAASSPHGGGFEGQPMSMMANTDYNHMGAASSSPMGGGFEGQPMSMMVNTDYNPAVMGGGGFEIPTPGVGGYEIPAPGDDPYDNPFSS